MPIGSTNRHARHLRRNATEAETILWHHLRGRRLRGLKFRRQATIGPYIADFLCAEYGLVLEVDGGQHGGRRDEFRTAAIERLGYRVIRFWNNDVIENIEAVLDRIASEAEALPPRFRRRQPSSNFD